MLLNNSIFLCIKKLFVEKRTKTYYLITNKGCIYNICLIRLKQL